MKYFRLLDGDVDTSPLLAEVNDNQSLWLNDTSRQDKVECQRKTNTIFLRTPLRRNDVHVNENQENQWSSHAPLFPKACAFMEAIAKQEDGTLSRATIVQLAPKSQVDPHIDKGAYYLIRNRFHLVLKSTTGSMMISGDEKNVMKEGELWWFDNNQHHAAMNASDEWRIHYIFDVLPNKYRELGKNPAPPSQYFRRG